MADKFCATFVLIVSSVILIQKNIYAETPTIYPVMETRPVYADQGFDADDPAIWVHPDDARDSLVLGTLKEGGLDVYDLDGEHLQYIPPANPADGNSDNNGGRYNNVDLIYGFGIGDGEVDLAVVSDKGYDQLRIYQINPDDARNKKSCLTEITAPNQSWIFSKSQEEVNDAKTAYGLAVSQPIAKHYALAYVSRNDTSDIAQILLYNIDNQVAYSILDIFSLSEYSTLSDGTQWLLARGNDEDLSKVEGMVIDDENQKLYLAQEDVGIWKTSLYYPTSYLELIDNANKSGIPHAALEDFENGEYAGNQYPGYGSDYLYKDVEGLTIYDAGNGQGYLIASSQGSSTFVIYDRITNEFISDFQVGDGNDVDGSQDCDGVDVTNVDLGGEFSGGLFVLQDGKNTTSKMDGDGEKRESTNFKYVKWEDIATELNLDINNKGARIK